MRQALLIIALGMGACASAPRPVTPDDMSAAQHRGEANREYKTAAGEVSRYDPRAAGLAGLPAENQFPEYYPLGIYNPTAWHLEAAQQHIRHAHEHEAAAAELERFEDTECHGVPADVRVSCPLLMEVIEIRDIPGGAEVRFTGEVPIDLIVGRMRCHLAYARARGFELPACPLYMKGVHIERGSGPAVELKVDDPRLLETIRRLVREQAIPR